MFDSVGKYAAYKMVDDMKEILDQQEGECYQDCSIVFGESFLCYIDRQLLFLATPIATSIDAIGHNINYRIIDALIHDFLFI